MADIQRTQEMYDSFLKNHLEASKVLEQVYESLAEKGYNPVNQLVGYIMSGDPTFITSHKNARSLIRRVERDELLEELVKAYIEDRLENKPDGSEDDAEA